MANLDELKRRARAGDLEALQQLRDSGFFQQPARSGYPVSHGQRRLWVLDRMAAHSPAYHIPLALRLEGALDTQALARALETIVARHESLRTTFAATGAEVRQFVHESVDFRLQEIDLSAARDGEAQAAELAARQAAAPFDLETGPLLRASLIRLAPRRWVFLFTIHHIVSDGWSLGVLVRELSSLYRAYAQGRDNPLPPLAIHYKDYAAWQNNLLSSEEAERHRQYWRAKLQGTPVLDLPLDYPRPAVMGFDGDTVSLPLDRNRLAGWQRLIPGTSLFIVLTALVKILLCRYTGQEDITVGCPVAGRDRPDLDPQIGFFVNTLALRDRLEGTDRFIDVLEKVRRTALEAYEHQVIPFDQLVTELNLERDVSRSPLFDVMVVLDTAEEQALALDNIQVSAFECPFRVAKFDLTFHFVETAGELRLALNYNRRLFREDKIRALADHLRRLAESAAAAEHTPIYALPLLSATETQRLLVEFNATAAPYPRDKTVLDLFQEQAARRPEQIALEHGAAALSYGRLNAEANALARYLRSLGVGPEVPVGICVQRSPAMVIGLLAILKAGGAYLPLDPAYPRERLAFMLADAQVPVLLTQADLAAALPTAGVQVVRLDADRDRYTRFSQENPAPLAGPANLAYLIYTSGSTGTPKGVPIGHAGLMNLVSWHRNRFAVTEADRATQLAGTAFDAAVWELWPYLTAGACVSLVEAERVTAPESLRDWLAARGITIAFVPTPLAELLLALPWPERPALRTLLTGGDRLHCYPPAGLPFRLVNNYGPTENTVVTTSGDVLPAAEAAETGLPPALGRPIANTRVYILDRHLQPVPAGVPGELYIAGPGLARGYLGRPELTAERFIPNPFSDSPGARLYRTGDRVRYRPAGNIDYLGRLDDQVKIRGFRIEPGEIETLLNRHPGVRESTVATRATAAGQELIAYLVPAPAAAPDSAELRRYLGRSLPEYMVPAVFVPLEALPLTAHGKVDRKGLPDPQRGGRSSRAPGTALERALVRLYQEVLGLEGIGVEDNFFELGGHSLSATQVVSRLRDIFKVEVPLPEFFRGSRVLDLAVTLQNREPQPGRLEKIAQILEKLGTLSEEEKKKLLAQKRIDSHAPP